MRKVPTIGAPGLSDEFHDSSLIDVQVSPRLAKVSVVLSTPTNRGGQQLWMLTFSGVLRVEFETTGSGGVPSVGIPLEIYSVYRRKGSDEERRWVARLETLGEPPDVARAVQHVVLASSFVRGWGENEALEGVSIICRDVQVEPAPRDYDGYEYERPRIEGE